VIGALQKQILCHIDGPILKPHGLSVISVKIFEYFAAPSSAAAHSLGTTALNNIHCNTLRMNCFKQRMDVSSYGMQICTGFSENCRAVVP
jgi:hypothetical protein